jgi:hypothetical protein
MLPGFSDEGRTVLGTINGIAYICCSLPMACNLLLEVLDLGMLVMVITIVRHIITKNRDKHTLSFLNFMLREFILWQIIFLCNREFLYVRYSFLLISRKFFDLKVLSSHLNWGCDWRSCKF